MADTELLNCPFCGSDEITVEQAKKGWYSAICGNCEAEGPPGYTHKDARLAWNGRPKQCAKSAYCNEKSDTCLASRPAEVDDEGLPPLPLEVARASKGEVAFFVKWSETGKALRGQLPLFTTEQFRQGQRDAVAADRARREKLMADQHIEGETALAEVKRRLSGMICNGDLYHTGYKWVLEMVEIVEAKFKDGAAPSHTTNKEK